MPWPTMATGTLAGTETPRNGLKAEGNTGEIGSTWWVLNVTTTPAQSVTVRNPPTAA